MHSWRWPLWRSRAPWERYDPFYLRLKSITLANSSTKALMS
jgi:hypothetical protein